jgi:hypothetical protein
VLRDPCARQRFNHRSCRSIAAEGDSSRGGSTTLRVNVTFTCALCPAASAIGNETPFKLNSGLLVLADETLTLEPLALSVAVKLLFWPTVMVPKSSVVGDSSNCPEAVAYPKAQSSNWDLKRQTQ